MVFDSRVHFHKWLEEAEHVGHSLAFEHISEYWHIICQELIDSNLTVEYVPPLNEPIGLT